MPTLVDCRSTPIDPGSSPRQPWKTSPAAPPDSPGRAFRRASLPGILAAGLALGGCGEADHDLNDEDIWDAAEWDVSVAVTEDNLEISATIADAHGDFIHVSIRREGHDSGYTIERSPAPAQPERDWSRVHHWFGELHPDTYLEGRIDDGSGRGPAAFQTFTFELPRGAGPERQSYAEVDGSDYEYITRGYSYADGASGHPPFSAGRYEIEIYAWYTGTSTDLHPAADDRPGVQYVHYERPLASTAFVIE